MERELNSEKIITTSRELRDWVGREFKDAHLAKVAAEVHSFAKEAVAKAKRIRRPYWVMRLATFALIAAFLGGIVYQVVTHKPEEVHKFVLAYKGESIYVIGIVILVFTLETRWKRRRAVEAISEIRAVAHIVDMHQLAKDQVMETFRENNQQDKIVEYLHACTCLLALLSKVAELYIEHFPDDVATSSVNDFEMIVTGMSSRIWMKILSMTGATGAGFPIPLPTSRRT